MKNKLCSCVTYVCLIGFERRLEEEGLPVPRSWAVLKPKADIAKGSQELVFEGSGGAGGETAGAGAGAGVADMDLMVRVSGSTQTRANHISNHPFFFYVQWGLRAFLFRRKTH